MNLHIKLMEEMKMQIVKLNNNIECPVIGIGTFMISPADAEVSVREALKMGYGLVDTAAAYQNEMAEAEKKVSQWLKEIGF